MGHHRFEATARQEAPRGRMRDGGPISVMAHNGQAILRDSVYLQQLLKATTISTNHIPRIS